MKLRGLECLCEIVACGFNLSSAARQLAASQPTITRQIQMLEHELGSPLLQRSGRKVVGLTAYGAGVHEHALRMLKEANALKRLSEDASAQRAGRLAIATTHFHAKHTLLEPVVTFRNTYPKVTVALVAGDTTSIADMVALGQVDMGVSVESIERRSELVHYPCVEMRHVLLTPKAHPLAKSRRVTPSQMLGFPLIVYGQRYGATRRVLQIFADRGLQPDIAMTTADVEVIKTYVAHGVGIAIVPERAYDARRDLGLVARAVDHLIPPVTATLSLRRGALLRPYAREFVQRLAPAITEDDLAQHAA